MREDHKTEVLDYLKKITELVESDHPAKESMSSLLTTLSVYESEDENILPTQDVASLTKRMDLS